MFGGSFSFSVSLYISDGAVLSCDILVGSDGDMPDFLNEGLE